MEGLLVAAVAAEIDRDRERRVRGDRLARRAGRGPRRPAGSWVLSGTIAPWLDR